MGRFDGKMVLVTAVRGATKAGVIGLTRSIAADFVGRGIRVDAIRPGTVERPSFDDRLRATGDDGPRGGPSSPASPLAGPGRLRPLSPTLPATKTPTRRASPT